MFFTKAGRVIAWLCVAGSILHYGYLQVVSFGQGGILPGHPMWNSLSAASKMDMQLLAFGVNLEVVGVALKDHDAWRLRLDRHPRGQRGVANAAGARYIPALAAFLL